jgi:signal transduction histidine kinase
MAILNIALNARDAMPTGGELVIMTNYDEHYAIVSIRDNGTGMSPKIAEQALTPFFTTKQEKGSGLGLSMVNNFARQSHGHVVIDSVVGGGTTVSIMLPRVIADQNDL